MKNNILYGCLGLALAAVTAAAQNAPPLQRPMSPKPVTARPTGLISVSTAESGALHTRAPLQRLPTFQATQLDGKSADIATFQQAKHWLLIYRRENCVPCDKLLSTLAASDNALLKSGTSLVVVVADNGRSINGNRLDALRAKFANFTAATWLEDSQLAAWKALKPRGTPMLYALSGDHIEWSLAGLQAGPDVVEKRSAEWLSSEDLQKAHPMQAASEFVISPSSSTAQPATGSSGTTKK